MTRPRRGTRDGRLNLEIIINEVFTRASRRRKATAVADHEINRDSAPYAPKHG